MSPFAASDSFPRAMQPFPLTLAEAFPKCSSDNISSMLTSSASSSKDMLSPLSPAIRLASPIPDDTLPRSDICRFAPPAVPLTLSVPTLVTSCLVFSSDVTVAAMSDNTGDVAVSCSNTMYHDGLQKPCVNAPVSIIFASPSAVESVKLSKDRLVLVPWRRAFRFSVRSRDDSCGSKGERSLGLITVLPMARRYCNEGNSRRLLSKE